MLGVLLLVYSPVRRVAHCPCQAGRRRAPGMIVQCVCAVCRQVCFNAGRFGAGSILRKAAQAFAVVGFGRWSGKMREGVNGARAHNPIC